MSHVYFGSGGSEAVEAALKLARQYFVEIGQPQRRHFIARRQSYHGNTLGALAAGGNAWRRRQFAPLLIDVAHVSPCYEYRDRHADESPEAYGARLAAELEERPTEAPENTIASSPKRWRRTSAPPRRCRAISAASAICDRHGILPIADGDGGMAHRNAAVEQAHRPDLMTVAKGQAAATSPSAPCSSTGVIAALQAGSGFSTGTPATGGRRGRGRKRPHATICSTR
jgi:adenosylmethionine-8-amino-7-oxononanoate aminotransferase